MFLGFLPVDKSGRNYYELKYEVGAPTNEANTSVKAAPRQHVGKIADEEAALFWLRELANVEARAHRAARIDNAASPIVAVPLALSRLSSLSAVSIGRGLQAEAAAPPPSPSATLDANACCICPHTLSGVWASIMFIGLLVAIIIILMRRSRAQTGLYETKAAKFGAPPIYQSYDAIN